IASRTLTGTSAPYAPRRRRRIVLAGLLCPETRVPPSGDLFADGLAGLEHRRDLLDEVGQRLALFGLPDSACAASDGERAVESGDEVGVFGAGPADADDQDALYCALDGVDCGHHGAREAGVLAVEGGVLVAVGCAKGRVVAAGLEQSLECVVVEHVGPAQEEGEAMGRRCRHGCVRLTALARRSYLVTYCSSASRASWLTVLPSRSARSDASAY